MTYAPLLKDVFDIPEVVSASDYVLELQKGVEAPTQTVADYVVTDSLATSFDESLDFVKSGVTTRKDRGVFLHGDFGSGKSHFMAVLDLVLRGDPAARAIPGLQATITDHEETLSANLLTVEYHLIGAESLEQALFSGYLDRVKKLHPDQQPPVLHKSEALFADAAERRAEDEEKFFTALNAGSSADSGWGSFEQAWTPQSYDAAVAADVADPERQRLAADLVATMFKGYVSAGEWLDVSEGLAVMSAHAQRLGYDGLVLFLDELVLWLASKLADQSFVSSEGAKVAKLVETGAGERSIPIISFVARQRELQDFYADLAGAGGAQRGAVGDAFQWWEGRFDTVHLEASNLPDIAHRRLLRPTDDTAKHAIDAALATLKGHASSWDALMLDEAQSGEVEFGKVYPFSPALVNTLVHLSGLLQRERTALRVMAQLLAANRSTRTIEQIIPVADLFDKLVLEGQQPLTPVVRSRFDMARRLYREKFRPVLLADHGLAEAEVEALPDTHPFRNDDRLAKTLLISGLVDVPALRDLTASKLAALNHGSVAAFIPGAEASTVLGKVRPWAEQIGELEVGDGADPVIKLVLSGVDYDSVVNLVQGEDTPGARRSLLRRMVFDQFGVADDVNLFGSVVPFQLVWRGTKRHIDVVFGNIRDTSAMPDDVIRADGDTWRLLVDYPFDIDGHVPSDDVVRFDALRSDGMESRTVGWVPRFLSAARQEDLGRLVLLEYLLGGNADQFDSNAQHLPADQRPSAKSMLENQRRALRDRVVDALKQAYGVAAPQATDIDVSLAEVDMLPTLDSAVHLQKPVGATLADALGSLADQMLSSQFPQHPKFESEVKSTDLGLVLDYVARAVSDPGGRVDPVESAHRSRLRRVANPLGCGQCYESHYVFSADTFPWRNEFVKLAAADQANGTVSVKALRDAMADRGLTKDTENLLIAAWALLDDKQFQRHGAAVRVTNLREVTDDLDLVDPLLPDQATWEAACTCAASLFGVSVGALRSAANLTALGAGVREAAGRYASSTRELAAELDRHATTLGLDATSPRRMSADAAAAFVPALAQEHDDLVLAGKLAGFDLPTEPQPLARSISSAANVVQALKATQWNVLDAVAGKAADDPKAAAALADLGSAAPADELHSPLQVALGQATTRAADYLAGSTPPPPPKPLIIDPPRHVNDITIQGIDSEVEMRLAEVQRQITAAAKQNPDKTVRISWWLE